MNQQPITKKQRKASRFYNYAVKPIHKGMEKNAGTYKPKRTMVRQARRDRVRQKKG